MKKILVSAIVILCFESGRILGQIPNSGFEAWTTTGGYQDPTYWGSTNSYSTGPFYAVTRSTDHYPSAIGSYSVRLENNVALNPNYSARGALFTGPPPPGPDFPISGHPTSLTGYYKFTPVNGDTMYIFIQLFKNGTPVSTGEFTSTASASGWTSFNISLSGYTAADSGSIILAAYYANGFNYIPHGNSVLYVDNLNFDNLIGTGLSESVESLRNFRLYPNANVGNFEVNFETVKADHAEIKIYDLKGVEVMTLFSGNLNSGVHTYSYNVRNLNSGNYLFVIVTGEGYKAEQICIMK